MPLTLWPAQSAVKHVVRGSVGDGGVEGAGAHAEVGVSRAWLGALLDGDGFTGKGSLLGFEGGSAQANDAAVSGNL